MTRTELLVGILGLLFLEVAHLKWIVWEYWDCRTHSVKNKECGCKAKWLLYF